MKEDMLVSREERESQFYIANLKYREKRQASKAIDFLLYKEGGVLNKRNTTKQPPS